MIWRISESLHKQVSPGLNDIGLLFMADRFPESGTKTVLSMNVYTKLGKQLSDTISCQDNFISSTKFVVIFVYLHSNRSTFALKAVLLKSNVCERFVSDYNVYT